MLRLVDSTPTPQDLFGRVLAAPFAFCQQTVSKIFNQIISTSNFQEAKELKQNIDLRPLLEWKIFVEGGLWAGFWGLCALFSGRSLRELYNELTIESSTSEKFSKINKALKSAFVDLLSLGGATAYNVHWAHEVKILSLGQYASLFKGLVYGASLMINAIEGGSMIYNIYTKKEAVLKEISPERKKIHKQQLCLSFIKLIGNISMIAWAMLGIAPLALSFTVNPVLMTTSLAFGFIFLIAAFFYQRHIENAPALRPLPKFNFSF